MELRPGRDVDAESLTDLAVAAHADRPDRLAAASQTARYVLVTAPRRPTWQTVAMRHSAPLVLPSLLLLLAACSAPDAPAAPALREPHPPSPAEAAETPRRLETFVDRVAEVLERDGAHHIGFERSARWYSIDPSRSPDAAALVAAARDARATRTPVRVTVDAGGTPTTKRPPRPGDPPPPLPILIALREGSERAN